MTVIAPEGFEPPPCSSCGRSDVAGVWGTNETFEPLCPECYERIAAVMRTLDLMDLRALNYEPDETT